ncbi:MAG: NAD(+)/NADH kinase [Christensenellales bacterium]
MIWLNIRHAGLLWNPTKGDGLPVANELTRLLARHGCRFSADQTLARILNCQSLPEDGDPGCDVLFVLGGDGTVLSALDLAVPHNIPILGINLGRMGFLTEVEPADLEDDLARLFAGDFRYDARMILEMAGAEESHFALNEVVVRRGTVEGILSVEVEVGGILVDRISGDGLIVSSATGSTAYSLSAGGPIVFPGMDCILLTPLCAHTMNARPVIASADERITVRVLDSPSTACAVFDGRCTHEFTAENPEITIRRSRRRARFIRLRDRNYFELLRDKLSEWTH